VVGGCFAVPVATTVPVATSRASTLTDWVDESTPTTSGAPTSADRVDVAGDEALEELLATTHRLRLVTRRDEVVVDLLQGDLAVQDVLRGRVVPPA
jgi:hypothetical protein